MISTKIDKLSLLQLRIAAEAVRSCDFTATAKVFGMTQPAVTSIVRKVEKTLAVRLIKRFGNVFSPTPEGVYLIDHYSQLASSVDKIIMIKNNYRSRGRIVSIGSELFNARSLKKPGRKLASKITFDVSHGELRRYEAAQSQFDAVIVPSALLKGEPSRCFEFTLAISKECKLANDNITFVIPSRQSPLAAKADRIIRYVKENNIEFITLDGAEATYSLVSSGSYAGLLPSSFMCERLEPINLQRFIPTSLELEYGAIVFNEELEAEDVLDLLQ